MRNRFCAGLALCGFLLVVGCTSDGLIQLPAGEIERLQTYPSIPALCYTGAVLMKGTASQFESPVEFGLLFRPEDPVRLTMERFVATLSKEARLANFKISGEAIPAAVADDTIPVLRRIVGHGFVLIFKTQRWAVHTG